METRSFSREHLMQLTEKFNGNLVNIRETLDSIKTEFTKICEQWQGGQSDNAKISINRINEAFAKIETDLTKADGFINEKANAFAGLRFNA